MATLPITADKPTLICLVRGALSDEALNRLAFLVDSFTTSVEIQEVIRPLLHWVTQTIPTTQIRQLSHQKAPVQINIKRISEHDIYPDVSDKPPKHSAATAPIRIEHYFSFDPAGYTTNPSRVTTSSSNPPPLATPGSSPALPIRPYR